MVTTAIGVSPWWPLPRLWVRALSSRARRRGGADRVFSCLPGVRTRPDPTCAGTEGRARQGGARTREVNPCGLRSPSYGPVAGARQSAECRPQAASWRPRPQVTPGPVVVAALAFQAGAVPHAIRVLARLLVAVSVVLL